MADTSPAHLCPVPQALCAGPHPPFVLTVLSQCNNRKRCSQESWFGCTSWEGLLTPRLPGQAWSVPAGQMAAVVLISSAGAWGGGGPPPAAL